LHGRLEALLDGGQSIESDPPTARAFVDLCERVRARAGAWWFARFADRVRWQLHAHVWEATNVATGVVPPLSAYVKMRPHVYWPCVTLAFIAADIPPDAAFLAHARVVALTEMALNQIVWVNDVLGVNREIEERSPHNLVLVLSRHAQLSLGEALRRAVDMTNAETEAMLELEARLPSFGAGEDAQLRRYLDTLHAWMRGHLDWYDETSRYSFDMAAAGSRS